MTAMQSVITNRLGMVANVFDFTDAGSEVLRRAGCFDRSIRLFGVTQTAGVGSLFCVHRIDTLHINLFIPREFRKRLLSHDHFEASPILGELPIVHAGLAFDERDQPAIGDIAFQCGINVLAAHNLKHCFGERCHAVTCTRT